MPDSFDFNIQRCSLPTLLELSSMNPCECSPSWVKDVSCLKTLRHSGTSEPCLDDDFHFKGLLPCCDPISCFSLRHWFCLVCWLKPWVLATPSNNILGLPVSWLLVVERRRKKEHVENGCGDKVEVLEELTPARLGREKTTTLIMVYNP